MNLLNNPKFDKEFMEFLIKPKELGGLGMLLPGEHYEAMKAV